MRLFLEVVFMLLAVTWLWTLEYRVEVIENQVCHQYTDYKHCENGKTIDFNGGIK